MFGNRLGWGISAAIALTTILLMWWLYNAGSQFAEPGAVGRNAASYSMQLPLDPRSLATWMSEEQDAVAIYKEAIAEFNARPQAFNGYLKKGKINSPEYAGIEKAINLLLKASTMKRPGVFTDRPGELITYDTDRPALKEALNTLRQVALKVGAEFENQKNYDKARDIYRAVYSLGVKLYEERLVFDEWDEARQTLAVVNWLAHPEIAASAEDGRRFKQVDDQIVSFYKSKIEPVQTTIFVLRPEAADRTWGDVAELAMHGGDPMWRVEATLALGRCRYTSPRAGDQFGATKLIDELLNDPEPRVKLAASVAKSLTREGVHKLR